VEGDCNESEHQLTGTETVYGGNSELAGSAFVSVKITGLGNFWEQLAL